MGGVYGMFLRD